MTPLHIQVRQALPQLDRDQAVLFSLACCQRAFPIFVGFYARGIGEEAPLALLDESWFYTRKNLGATKSWFPNEFVDRAREDIEKLIGVDEDEDYVEDENWAPAVSCCGHAFG